MLSLSETAPSKSGNGKTHLLNALNDTKQFIEGAPLNYMNDENIVNWYSDLCRLLTELINSIGEVCRGSNSCSFVDKQLKDSILLHLTQLISLLALLIDIFLKESSLKSSIIEARRYAIKQLVTCLNGLENTLLTVDLHVIENGNFIKWMNVAIENLSHLNINEGKNKTLECFREVKASSEEVLCHGMSIAQVALSEDCNIIKGSSQAVLEALSSLHSEILKQDLNKAMVNLFKDTCRIKLCNLEERVNLAVLRLCAEVFSEYTTFLNKIYCFCIDINNKGKTEELEAIVVDFDLHVDRIMQIGLFAISCSSEGNHGIKIKSCLASLEALENELVPAFFTLLTDCSFQNKHYARILKRHWEQQANQLKNCVYHIIEPYAFCKVINQQMKADLRIIVDKVTLGEFLLNKISFRSLLNYGTVLSQFMYGILSIEVDQSRKDQANVYFKEFRKVFKELKTAIDILLSENNRSLHNCSRIIKRCKILISTSENLQQIFVDDLSNKENESLKHSPDKLVPNAPNKFLEHIINRGKIILNERSILYRTPIKTPRPPNTEKIQAVSKDFTFTVDSSFRCTQHSRLKFATPRKNDKEINFDIAEILHDLTHMTIFKGEKG